MNLFKRNKAPKVVQQVDEDLAMLVEKKTLQLRDNEKHNLAKSSNDGDHTLSKGYGGKQISYTAPAHYIGSMDVSNGFTFQRHKGSTSHNYRDNNKILKSASDNIIVNAIIVTRANQVSAYGQPARYNDEGIGFEVVPESDDILKSNGELKQEDKKRILEIEDFINNLGNEKHADRNFRSWTKQVVRDTLVYDQTNTEIIYDKNKKPKSFLAVDASTIFHATDDEGHPVPDNTKGYKYVQVLDENTANGYKDGELTFDVMNPRTDIYAYKYGISPLEVSIAEVKYHEDTEGFNARYFSQGGTTMGLLNIHTGGSGQQTEAAMDDFRRTWTSNFSGTNGAWKIPVISAEKAEYINMNQSSKDMEFEKWINYLINVLCANFQISSDEINFPNRGGATGSKGNSLQEASKKEGAELSQDKGLRPLLEFIEDVINWNIMPKFYGGKFRFQFRGNSVNKELQMLDKMEKEVTTYKTLNEVRSENGFPPIEAGDLPLNAIAIQRQGQINQMQLEADKAKQEEKQAKELAEQQPDQPDNGDNSDGSFQDSQKANAAGQDLKDDNVKKDGQLRNSDSGNQNLQAGKENN